MKADIMLTPDTRVLEIGCGEGGNLLPFAEKGCNIESPYKKDFMLYIKHFLKQGGIVFFSFPAWHNPFGGHQQIAVGFGSKLPFIHLLPKPL